MGEQLTLYSDFISSLINDYDLPADLVGHIEDIQIQARNIDTMTNTARSSAQVGGG